MKKTLVAALCSILWSGGAFAADIWVCNDQPGRGLGCSIGTITDVSFYAGADEFSLQVNGKHEQQLGGKRQQTKWYNPNTWMQTVVVGVRETYPACVIRFKFAQYQEGLALLNQLKQRDYKKITCRSNDKTDNADYFVTRVDWNAQGSVTVEY